MYSSFVGVHTPVGRDLGHRMRSSPQRRRSAAEGGGLGDQLAACPHPGHRRDAVPLSGRAQRHSLVRRRGSRRVSRVH